MKTTCGIPRKSAKTNHHFLLRLPERGRLSAMVRQCTHSRATHPRPGSRRQSPLQPSLPLLSLPPRRRPIACTNHRPPFPPPSHTPTQADPTPTTTTATGYRYWTGGTTSAPPPPPLRLSPDRAAAATAAAAAAAGSASLWNAAGTWEDRDVTDRAKEALKAAVQRAGTDAGVASLRVASAAGHASIVVVRGRPRPGFEFEDVVIEWGGGEQNEPASTARAASLSSTDVDDVELDVTTAPAKVTAAIAAALAALLDEMQAWV